ncbi:MAG: SLBB domain-containing protein [Gammaproteobacteria bacterium]
MPTISQEDIAALKKYANSPENHMLVNQHQISDQKSQVENTEERSIVPSRLDADDYTGIPRMHVGDTLILQFSDETDDDYLKEILRRLPEKKLFVLDKSGTIYIPNFGRFHLSGLSEKEAAARLMAEPVFSGLDVKVKLLMIDQELKEFGYELFLAVPDTFTPVTNIPVPTDYVVGPGDTVVVQLFGKENAQYELPINRDGQLLFPSIGPISVSGLEFKQLQSEIESRVSRQLIGVKASVTLGKLRSIRVFVLGEVNHPGSYTVSSLSTLTNALLSSGGVKTIGSLRQIQLKRNGSLVSELDLYDLLLDGDTSGDARLQPGDVIFVPPAKNKVSISGKVRRPAIYELKNEKTLSEVFNLSGGLMPDAFIGRVQLKRIENNRERVVLDVDLSTKDAGKFELKAGDSIRVFSVLDNFAATVKVSGYVVRPGNVQWHQDMRLTDVIKSVQDLAIDADSRYVLIRRINPLNNAYELVSTNLSLAWSNPEGEYNTRLESGDEIHVFDILGDRGAYLKPLIENASAIATPEKPLHVVSIEGMVHHSGDFPLTSGMTIRDLIFAAGGLLDSAYLLNAELTRFVNVDNEYREHNRLDIELAAVMKDDASNIQLSPYDQVVIKRLPNWNEIGVVQIEGEIVFPGKYPVSKSEKLSSVLKRAGGITKSAFVDGAIFVRESIRLREQEQLKKLTKQLQRDIKIAEAEEMSDPKALIEGETLLEEISKAKATGRMVIELKAILDGNDDLDVTVQPGDRLYIPQKYEEVTVLGEVYYPTSHLYKAKYKKKDYLRLSGGVNENGNKSAIYVVHANGAVSVTQNWFGGRIDIGPGDIIVVPPKVDRVSQLKLYTDISQVIYQLAITVASLKAINVF